MSTLRANSISDAAGTGAPEITKRSPSVASAWLGTSSITIGYNTTSFNDAGTGDFYVNYTNVLVARNAATSTHTGTAARVSVCSNNLTSQINVGLYLNSADTRSDVSSSFIQMGEPA